jgi:hypothetical protein
MLNYDHQRRCIICRMVQPDAAPAAANTWACDECGMINFAYQGLCIVCSAPQPIHLTAPPIPPPLLPPPEPDFDLLVTLQPDFPDLDALISAAPAAETARLDAHNAARRAATRDLLIRILGGDGARADRFLTGVESVSLHDVLRRAPRYGDLLAEQRRWIKGAEQPLYVVDAARDLTSYVTTASQNGITPLEGVIVKAEAYRECPDGRETLTLYLDYEFPAPQTRKRLDGVALIPISARPNTDALPAPGTRALIGYVNDKLHDLM